MLQSKYVVVEVTTTTATMTLVQYLITNGFDKFTVVADLFDHPSLKGKGPGGSSPSTTPPPAIQNRTTTATPTPTPPPAQNGKPRISINDIASALSKRSSPSEQQTNGCAKRTPTRTPPPTITPLATAHSTLARILEEKSRLEAQKEQAQQNIDIQKIILGQTALEEEHEETHDEEKTDNSSDSLDFGLGPSDEQVRASMIHLLNPVLGSAFGFNSSIVEEACSSPARRKAADEGAPERKKHRWMTNNELEESRFGRGKNYGRVHCKATYKCALCGKPTTLNSTGSRWNLLRHVIMIHSESKPYQCYDCDFIGIKSNVVSHARQSGHRSDDALDITTDEMRADWNQMLHACFPDYVKAKSRGWQPDPEVKEEPEVEIKPILPEHSNIKAEV